MKRIALITLTTLLMISPAVAQDAVRSARSLSLAFANELAAETLKSCKSKGYKVVVAVVDRAGQILPLQRDEDARAHAIELAQKKAYTSAMLGGMPIKSKDEVIGGFGVSGAPGGHLDQECGEVALKALQAKL